MFKIPSVQGHMRLTLLQAVDNVYKDHEISGTLDN